LVNTFQYQSYLLEAFLSINLILRELKNKSEGDMKNNYMTVTKLYLAISVHQCFSTTFRNFYMSTPSLHQKFSQKKNQQCIPYKKLCNQGTELPQLDPILGQWVVIFRTGYWLFCPKVS